MKNQITVRPGPMLHVFRSGSEFCVVPLDYHAALALIGSITAALQLAERPTTNTPNEGLAVEEHIAKRETQRAAFEVGWKAAYGGKRMGKMEELSRLANERAAELAKGKP